MNGALLRVELHEISGANRYFSNGGLQTKVHDLVFRHHDLTWDAEHCNHGNGIIRGKKSSRQRNLNVLLSLCCPRTYN